MAGPGVATTLCPSLPGFIFSLSSKNNKTNMSLFLGDIAPDFSAETTQGPIQFHQYIEGSWAVFFSHPKDFTPVCTTELGAAARLAPEFEKRGVKMLAISVDPIEDHHRWVHDIEETQACQVTFPLVADPDRSIAIAYGMLNPAASETATVRSVFIIGPDKKIKLSLTYPASTGRNFQELLRVVDSLQLTAKHSVATPADWQDGQDVIVALSLNDEQAHEKFNGNVRSVKPYLRYTPDPA